MNEHSHHRRRLRNRFLAEGLDNFEEHQIIEMLLFYGIPRVDTNEIAHKLIKRFGSLRGILDADLSELVTVEGVGENIACLIKFSSALARRYALSETTPKQVYDTIEKIGKYLTSIYMGVSIERVYLIMFNGKMEILKTVMLFEGDINAARFDFRSIVENALLCKASGIVIGHNHPRGLPVPSSNDLSLTAQIQSICNSLNINLIDHFIVAENKYATIIHSGLVSTL